MERLRQIFDPLKHRGNYTHGSHAIAVRSAGDIVELFFNQRDSLNRSVVSRAFLDMTKLEIVHVDGAILKPSEAHPRSFRGISVGNIVNIKGSEFLSLMGWSASESLPWVGSLCGIGLGANFGGIEESLILDIGPSSLDGILSCSYPFIDLVNEQELRVFFGGTTSWSETGGMVHSLFSLSGASLENLRDSKPFRIRVNDSSLDSYLISRPWIIGDRTGTILFSAREPSNTNYSIYSARIEGHVLVECRLLLPGSGRGWDSHMSCYCSAFDYDGNSFLLYSGNGYGFTGFGLAIID